LRVHTPTLWRAMMKGCIATGDEQGENRKRKTMVGELLGYR